MKLFEILNFGTKFIRTPLYTETYLTKIKPHEQRKAKFRTFMETKRNNIKTIFGSSDKPFKSKGSFGILVPGIRHAHITYDISIVYLVQNNTIILYGFFTHDELGTGTPPKINIQKSMAIKFKTLT